MFRQETDPLGVKKLLIKMINRHIPQFEQQRSNSGTVNATC